MTFPESAPIEEPKGTGPPPAAAPPWLAPEILDRVIRVDVGLEGDWSGTVVAVWDRASGFSGLPEDLPAHPRFRPCVELYLEDGWIGIHCFRVERGLHVLDRERARAIVALLG